MESPSLVQPATGFEQGAKQQQAAGEWCWTSGEEGMEDGKQDARSRVGSLFGIRIGYVSCGVKVSKDKHKDKISRDGGALKI
jgi:hypothetical protein